MTMLPPQFADLEPWARTWSLASEQERWDRRHASTMEELIAFYDAVFPRLEEAIEFCDKHDLDDLPEDVLNLLHLIYSLALVAMAVEIFGQPKTVDSADATLTRVAAPTP